MLRFFASRIRSTLLLAMLAAPLSASADDTLAGEITRLKNPDTRKAAAAAIFQKCLPGKDTPAVVTGPAIVAPLSEALFYENSTANARRVLDAVRAAQPPPATPVPWPAPDAEGFTPLFNGKNFDGWKGDTRGYFYNGDVLVVTRLSKQIETERHYRDFHLKFEHRLTPHANNGIWLRGGFESQILDDTHPDYSKLRAWQYCGGIYGAIAPKRGHLKPLGEWNQEEIILEGRRVKVILNDTVIIDANLDEGIEASRKSGDSYGLKFLKGMLSPSGSLGLCSHNEHLEYRGFRIKELNRTPTLLSADKELSQWVPLIENPIKRSQMSKEDLAAAQAKARPTLLKNWIWQDGGVIYSEGKGSNLCTREFYGDFDLSLEWKISPNSDSGIYLRGTPQVQIWDPSNPKEKRNGADKGSGGLWNNRGAGKWPLVLADKPLSEWNQMRVLMVGSKVTVWLNGQEVVHHAPLDNYWARNKPLPAREQIELQAHNSPVWFRNVTVTALD